MEEYSRTDGTIINLDRTAMIITITSDICWTPAQELYLGQVIEAGPYEPRNGRHASPQARLVFSLEHHDESGNEYRVQKIYPAAICPNSALRRDLEVLLGADALMDREQVDLDEAFGKAAVVQVIHIHNPKYDQPFVTFDRLYSPETSISAVVEPGVRTKDQRPQSMADNLKRHAQTIQGTLERQGGPRDG